MFHDLLNHTPWKKSCFQARLPFPAYRERQAHVLCMTTPATNTRALLHAPGFWQIFLCNWKWAAWALLCLWVILSCYHRMPRLGIGLLETLPEARGEQAGESSSPPSLLGGSFGWPKIPTEICESGSPSSFYFLMLMSLTTAHLAPFLLNHKHGKIPEVTSALKK